jgi:phage tail-like protein
VTTDALSAARMGVTLPAPGTESLRVVRGPGPPVASRRAVLRRGLPSVYRDDALMMKFLEAIETVLDPLMAMLDSLPAHFDVALAPDDVLDLVATWFGVQLDESLPEDRRRQLVRQASDLARRQGTRAGIELALHLAFPGLPVEVEDGGRTAGALEPEELPPAGRGELVVRCRVPVPTEVAGAVARTIEEVKPADVPYKLRVRTPSANGDA